MRYSADLNVFLTCMREEENLKILLPRLCEVLSGLGIKYKILVVDTVAPMDGTPEVCGKFENVLYLPTDGDKDGYGNAVRTGIRNLDSEYAILMDGDLSHPPEVIPEMFSLRNECDMVIASRYVEGGSSEDYKLNYYMSRLLNIAYSLVTGINCKDWSTSFKLYRTSQIQALELKRPHFDIHQEIIFKLRRQKEDFKFAEVPMSFRKRLHGSSTRRSVYMLSLLITLIRLRLGLI